MTEKQKSINDIVSIIEDLSKSIMLNNIEKFDDATMLQILVEDVLPDMVESFNNDKAIKQESIAMVCGVCSQFLARELNDLTNSANNKVMH